MCVWGWWDGQRRACALALCHLAIATRKAVRVHLHQRVMELAADGVAWKLAPIVYFGRASARDGREVPTRAIACIAPDRVGVAEDRYRVVISNLDRRRASSSGDAQTKRVDKHLPG